MLFARSAIAHPLSKNECAELAEFSVAVVQIRDSGISEEQYLEYTHDTVIPYLKIHAPHIVLDSEDESRIGETVIYSYQSGVPRLEVRNIVLNRCLSPKRLIELSPRAG
jgi:hypothetical protein